MFSRILRMILFVIATEFVSATLTSSLRGANRRKTSLRGNILHHELDCTMVLTETRISDEEEEEQWECINSLGQFIELDINYDSDYRDPEVGLLTSGETILHTDDALFLSETEAIIKAEPHFSQANHTNRRNLRRLESQTRSVLVVRVEGNDAKPTPTESDLASKVFGIGNEDSFNLSSGFDQCSYGKVKMEPTEAFEDGVYTMTIDHNIIGEKHTDIRNIALQQLHTEMETTDLTELFDHVAFCFPHGTESKTGSRNWSAYGIVNGYVTLFNNEWCTSTSALMHEFGHNLGLRHSNKDGEYKDMSGMMGHSFLGAGLPKMCFNTAKNWQLNWFQNKQETVNPLENRFWEGDFIGISDYKHAAAPQDSKVILKIEGHSKNFFVGFNRKAGINAGNQEIGGDNRVTIHSTEASNPTGASELEAKLTIGEQFEIPLFGETEQSVLVQVEDIDMSAVPAVARVSVTYLRCTSDFDCDDGSSCTTDTCNHSTGKCIHTPNDLCSDFMEMILKTDRYPSETSWSIVDNCKGDEVVMQGERYDQKFTTYKKTAYAHPSKYTLKIHDAYGDGICCSQGDGHFALKVNNEDVVEGGDFGHNTEYTWGSCETEAPSPSPTLSPTKTPTVAPTACEMKYELAFKAGTYNDATSWKLSHDRDLSVVEDSRSVIYNPGYSYYESGCLMSNCYHFDIIGAEFYTLIIDGKKVASGTQIEDTEISLFGTCQ